MFAGRLNSVVGCGGGRGRPHRAARGFLRAAATRARSPLGRPRDPVHRGVSGRRGAA
jgi:hypothetical protein